MLNTPNIDPYTTKERHEPSPGFAALRRLAARIATIFGSNARYADADSVSNAGTRRTHHPERRRSVPRRLAARSGLATREIVTLIALIVVITVLGAGALVVGRNWINSSHDRAAKETVDRVMIATENYWQQFALSRSGARKIDFSQWCAYLNQQFGNGDDLTLRAADTIAAANTAAGGQIASATDGIDSSNNSQAKCGDDTGSSVDNLAAGTTGLALSTWQENGLGNGNSVLLIRPKHIKSGANSTHWGTDGTGDLLPAGTNVKALSTSGGNGEDLEVVSVAAVSSTGTSFCAVYVLDADEREKIGVYRFVQLEKADGSSIHSACVAGHTEIADGSRANEVWPS